MDDGVVKSTLTVPELALGRKFTVEKVLRLGSGQKSFGGCLKAVLALNGRILSFDEGILFYKLSYLYSSKVDGVRLRNSKSFDDVFRCVDLSAIEQHFAGSLNEQWVCYFDGLLDIVNWFVLF